MIEVFSSKCGSCGLNAGRISRAQLTAENRGEAFLFHNSRFSALARQRQLEYQKSNSLGTSNLIDIVVDSGKVCRLDKWKPTY